MVTLEFVVFSTQIPCLRFSVTVLLVIVLAETAVAMSMPVSLFEENTFPVIVAKFPLVARRPSPLLAVTVLFTTSVFPVESSRMPFLLPDENPPVPLPKMKFP